MYFLSLLVKITRIVSSLFISKFKPYIISNVGQFNIAVPNNDASKYLIDSKVYLSYPNGVRVDITQPPGTKYPYLPSEFQADSYIVVRDGKETFIQDYISVNNTVIRKMRRDLLD